MQRLFRKYHRTLAIIICLPLVITVLSGLGYTLADEWLGNSDLAETILKFHTMEIIGLEKIYPLLNALGVVGLVATGISMTSLFRNRPAAKNRAGS